MTQKYQQYSLCFTYQALSQVFSLALVALNLWLVPVSQNISFTICSSTGEANYYDADGFHGMDFSWIFYINKMPKKAKEMDYIFLLRPLKSNRS